MFLVFSCRKLDETKLNWHSEGFDSECQLRSFIHQFNETTSEMVVPLNWWLD